MTVHSAQEWQSQILIRGADASKVIHSSWTIKYELKNFLKDLFVYTERRNFCLGIFKVALYRFFSLSFMFSLRHVFSSTVGPNDTHIAIVFLCAEQPKSWIQISQKNAIKSHLKVAHQA